MIKLPKTSLMREILDTKMRQQKHNNDNHRQHTQGPEKHPSNTPLTVVDTLHANKQLVTELQELSMLLAKKKIIRQEQTYRASQLNMEIELLEIYLKKHDMVNK